MWKSTARYLHQRVKRDYDLIAEDFSKTRETIWKDFLFFEPYLRHGMDVLDCGCGNGRLIEMLDKYDLYYTGMDISDKLLSLARDKYPHHTFYYGDVLKLPFLSGSFDAVFLLAVLHHVPSLAFRVCVLREVYRVLRPGGVLLLSVWNLRLFRYKFYVLQGYVRASLTFGRYDFGDVFIPWKAHPHRQINRYCHVFCLSELVDLCTLAGFEVIESFGAKNGVKCIENEAANLCVAAKK